MNTIDTPSHSHSYSPAHTCAPLSLTLTPFSSPWRSCCPTGYPSGIASFTCAHQSAWTNPVHAPPEKILSRSPLRSSCSSSLSSTLTFTSPPSSSLVHTRVATLPPLRCGLLPRCVFLFSRCPVSLLSFCWLLLVSSPPPSLELPCRFASFFFVSCLFPLFFVAFTLPLVPSFLLLPLFLHRFTAHIKQQTRRRPWPSPIHPLCG